ncbi:unnamed protein product, partial [Hapterophycus canaliculatus]
GVSAIFIISPLLPNGCGQQAANMYCVRAYATGYAVAEVPYILFVAFAFCSIFYWVTGLADSVGQFFFFCVHLSISETRVPRARYIPSATLFLQILPDTKVAQTLGGVLTTMFSIFAGFLISPGKIPDAWLFAYYLNPLHYIVEV